MLSTVLGRLLTFFLSLSFVLFAAVAAYNVPDLISEYRKADSLKASETQTLQDYAQALQERMQAEQTFDSDEANPEALTAFVGAAAKAERLKRQVEKTEKDSRYAKTRIKSTMELILVSGLPLFIFASLAWILHPAIKRRASKV